MIEIIYYVELEIFWFKNTTLFNKNDSTQMKNKPGKIKASHNTKLFI